MENQHNIDMISYPLQSDLFITRDEQKTIVKYVVKCIKGRDFHWKLRKVMRYIKSKIKNNEDKCKEFILDKFGIDIDEADEETIELLKALIRNVATMNRNKENKAIRRKKLIESMKNLFHTEYDLYTGHEWSYEELDKRQENYNRLMEDEWKRVMAYIKKKERLAECWGIKSGIVRSSIVGNIDKSQNVRSSDFDTTAGDSVVPHKRFEKKRGYYQSTIKYNESEDIKSESKHKKNLLGYIEEQCEICVNKEKKWEYLKKKYSDSLTTEDAIKLKSKLVRGGGMRFLIDNFKNIFEAELPQEMILPAFVSAFSHPDNTKKLNETIKYYHYMKIILEEILDKNQEILNSKVKSSDDDESYLECMPCQRCSRCR